MRMTLRLGGVIVGGLLGLAPSLAAQSAQRISLQASGAVLFATREDPAGFQSKTRLGFEGQLRYTFSRFSLGAGYQRSTVFTSPALNLSLSLGFIEPRLVVAAGGGLAFYLAGRAGIGKLVCSETCNATKVNKAFGGGGGVLLRLGRRISADLGAQYFQMSGDLSSGYVMARAGLGLGL
jgi:hypothetical protein